jgi:hypothetical protein
MEKAKYFLLPFAFCLLPFASQTQAPVVAPQPIATPAAPNSGQPQLSVSTRGVLLSWIERGGDLATLKFSERTARAGGAENHRPGRDWFVNWADVPSVLRLPSGALVARWLRRAPDDLRLRCAALLLHR